jgi:asparagine synthase (glutamine-hydrolysing)
MFRFLAMLWNGMDSRSAAQARLLIRRLRSADPRWSLEMDGFGLAVLHVAAARPASLRCHRLPEDRGVVLGTLYRNTDEAPSQVIALSPDEAAHTLATRGAHLVDNFWGRYIAVFEQRGAGHCVLRDPTGALPCYIASVGGITFAFAQMGDFLRLAAPGLTINWRHVCSYLRFGRLITDTTGFDEIGQVQAGERVEIDAAGVRARTFLWHPKRICELPAIEDPNLAVATLGRSIRRSVSAWSSGYGRVLLELSGGLDSSIVLACLAQGEDRSKIVCLNMYTTAPEGDERYFARKAATRAQCVLVETVFRSTTRRLEKMLDTALLPSPTSMTMASESEEVRRALALEHGVEAIFSGQGGDNFFQRRRDAGIAAEFVHRHALRPGLLRIVADTARMTGASIWSVLNAALRQGLRPDGFDPYGVFKMPPFLCTASQALADLEHIRHPWVLDAPGLPRSKIQQIFDVVDAQAFHAGACNYADVVHPLISQPIIECILRIPSYVLTIGGVERGLARRAFAADVPREILTRTSKGAVTGYFYDLVLNNLTFIREFLLDGLLVKERLLDRARIEAALNPGAILRHTPLQPTLSSIFAESWVRTATDSLRQTAMQLSDVRNSPLESY